MNTNNSALSDIDVLQTTLNPLKDYHKENQSNSTRGYGNLTGGFGHGFNKLPLKKKVQGQSIGGHNEYMN
jgi:hypothetical protein